MALFVYKATDLSGKVEQDMLEARDRNAAVSMLQSRGLIPLSVNEARKGKKAKAKGMKIKARYLEQFTQELYTLVKAGLPLSRALNVMHEISETEQMAEVIEDISDKVKSGKSLSEAMEDHPRTFNPMYTNMIRSGEASGQQQVILGKLSNYLEKSETLKRNVISSLIYPAILISVCILAVFVLMTWVVPKFIEQFKENNIELPLLTQILVAISDTFVNYWWAILGLFISCFIAFQMYVSHSEGRYAWDKFKLGFPIFGNLFRKMEMANFSQTVATMLETGVPLLEALDIAKNTVTNTFIRKALEDAADSLRAGKPISVPLDEAGCFPPLAVNMIRVGEETGQMADMLNQVASRFASETEATLQRLLTLLEPAIIVIMGGIVGFIVLSIILAMLEATNI